jgi:hypothetical protein
MVVFHVDEKTIRQLEPQHAGEAAPSPEREPPLYADANGRSPAALRTVDLRESLRGQLKKALPAFRRNKGSLFE